MADKNVEKRPVLSKISVGEAHSRIKKTVSPTGAVEISLPKLSNRVCAEDVHAPISLPRFRQSSVDGYAITDISTGAWKLIGENRAAKNLPAPVLGAEEAVKIYTGSLIPDNADAIVMVEDAEIVDGILRATADIRAGEHIREIGSHVEQGAKVLEAGTRISPATVGMLAGLGIQSISAHIKPKISLIISGDEIRTLSEELTPGTVYESNSFVLSAAIEAAGYELVLPVRVVGDDLQEISDLVNKCAGESDFVLLSGGMSVGDFDFGAEALKNAGGVEVFHRIAQRPGKPLLMGSFDKTIFFGLPGNPVSALVCFYEYVLPALRMSEGQLDSPYLRSEFLTLARKVSKQRGLHYFVRGKVEGTVVIPLEGQLSYNMLSFSKANALISIGAELDELPEGAPVEVHFLP